MYMFGEEGWGVKDCGCKLIGEIVFEGEVGVKG